MLIGLFYCLCFCFYFEIFELQCRWRESLLTRPRQQNKLYFQQLRAVKKVKHFHAVHKKQFSPIRRHSKHEHDFVLTVSITIDSLEYSLHNLINREIWVCFSVSAFLHPIDALERKRVLTTSSFTTVNTRRDEVYLTIIVTALQSHSISISWQINVVLPSSASLHQYILLLYYLVLLNPNPKLTNSHDPNDQSRPLTN